MGVQGLWQLLNPTGRPVSLQSLEGKVLAVDVSIWLHQAVKGMRDKDGNPLPNAHLQVLFNRLCKLLFYRIKPVFVFDGGVPVLKRQTMEGRRQKKDFAELESDKATKSLVQNLLKSHAINEVLKKDDKKVPTRSGPKPSTSKAEKPDLFELPPLPEEFKSITEESRRKEFTAQERMLLDDIDVNQIDIDSEVFNSLPAEMKHEVLTLMKEKKKRHTWNQILELPEESVDFSQFQMAKLMKQSKLSSQIEQVKKEMNDNRSNELTTFLGDDFYSDAIETRKIMSDDSTHSILIKGLGSKEQMEEMERIKLELEEKRKKEKMEDTSKEVDMEASVADKTKSIEFVEIEFHPKTSTNLDQSDATKAECSSKNENERIVEDVHSERQDILKEIQERMNVLKDDNPSDVVKMESENDLITKMDTEENESLLTNKNTVSEMTGSHDNGIVEVPERNNKVIETKLGTNVENEIVCMDTNKTNSSDKAVFQIPKDKIHIGKKSISSVNSNENNSLTQNTEVDLASKRLSILDELRQKVNVLSTDIPEEGESETLDKDDKNGDTEKTSEIQQDLVERRKVLLRKQLSHDEGQIVKKRKIGDTEIVEDRSQINVVENSSESESEDEGFIEVTFDPDRAQADDLFPADIFQKVDSTENVDTLNVDIETNMYSSSPEIQEVITEPGPEMSEEEEEEEETVKQRSPDKDGGHYTDLVDQFNNFTENDMRDYQENLEVESRDLQQERGRQERLAVSITDQMYIEAQELLELFGVPYLISPMEAEAQCAQLDATDLTQGTITDDSDIWLFGGKRVYKNFFYQDKHVEFFSDISIKSQIGLGRDVFIKLALLCGSDYTDGIPGVGVITAMELLTEFPGEELEGLKAFKKWWDGTKTQITAPLEAKVRTKLRKLQVSEGFPNEVVVGAYMSPEIEDSQEKFTWGQPELDLIRIFTKKKFGWSKEKCDESLVPMMKQLNLKHTQTRINSFFQPESFLQPKNIKSKRLQKAIDIMQGKTAVAESGTLLNQSSSSPSQHSKHFQSSRMQQITVGKGRIRGRGKGKGKGKSSAGQRSKVVITKEVNLSESSSESSGDELIANLDYESIVGEQSEIPVRHDIQASSKTNTQENTKPMSIQAKKKSTNAKRKRNRTINDNLQSETSTQPKCVSRSETRISNSLSDTLTEPNNVSRTDETRNSTSETSVQPNSDSGTSRTETGTESQTGTAEGGRTKPKLRIGKAGHATEDFSWDLPKEPVTKGFLEDEAAEFDRIRKVKSKTKNVKSVDDKEPKADKGKKLAKNSQPTKRKNDKGKKLAIKEPMKITDKSSELTKTVSYTNENSNVITSDSLLNRQTRSCKTGSVNRVVVMSDSDSG